VNTRNVKKGKPIIQAEPKQKVREIVHDLELDRWVYYEVGRVTTRQLLAHAKRRILATGENSLRCLQTPVLAEIYPKAENPRAFALWKLRKNTQLRRVLDVLLQDALTRNGIDEEFIAVQLKACI